MTEEQQRAEAEEGLRSAIIRYAEALGCDSPGDFLGDFIVVASWIPPLANGRSQYNILMTGETPRHIPLGLLAIGRQLLDDLDRDDPGY